MYSDKKCLFKRIFYYRRMIQNYVNRYSYWPFGQITSQSQTVDQPFKYVGQYGVMAETNALYYMRARYYDASWAVYIRRSCRVLW